jgi:hypothetical protein
MPLKCTARLYPEEVLHAIQSATYTSQAEKENHMRNYEYYRKLFAQKFGKPIGLARSNNTNINASNRKNMEGGKKTRKAPKQRSNKSNKSNKGNKSKRRTYWR